MTNEENKSNKDAPLYSYDSMMEFAARARTHVVGAGDSLRKLALEYYGDAKKWRLIYEANLSRIMDPKKIQVGQKFIIPHLGW
ncbi:LysM peptidoglycan-binding domain-containing protein [Fulvivirga sedimenti]|jgi:nucleoid-associated protein YgaU|uniref:LysM peptidoglycan-binding domain-containing protein n=1 Tax=Fulvivirga sedimenti TaxID=2879465 RepID=A0A9X1KWP2_9BACT|nr:LysM peptidoglycan-binding domain-containing protein [Fulvivirga sedimenti]MCA6073442.1 LysM peptidoglycan-binding domain-containing protein [Fulvivirga sedimenti]